jgi:CheY-like chemotaxis protein
VELKRYQLILFAQMTNDRAATRILVVDDDEVSREVLSLLLNRQGYIVETVDSGDAALLHLSGMQKALPDVILVDLQMPGTMGSDLAQQLRPMGETRTMLLAMSGSEPEETVRRAFNGFLLKPFTMEELAMVIAGDSSGGPGEAVRQHAAALDEAVYNKLVESLRKEQLERLYALCLEDAKKRIAVMRQEASKGDDAHYRREAHAIKGSCGIVGASELQRLATSMEEQGIGVTDHVVSLDEFILACERLQGILIARGFRG